MFLPVSPIWAGLWCLLDKASCMRQIPAAEALGNPATGWGKGGYQKQWIMEKNPKPDCWPGPGQKFYSKTGTRIHGVASLAGGGLTVPSLNIGRCPTVVWGRVAWRRSSVQRWGPWICVCFLFYFLQLLRYTWTKKPSLEYNFCFWTRHWLLLFTYFSSMPWLMWHPNFSYAVCSQMRMKMVCDAPGCGCVELFAHSLRHLTKAGLAENHLM